jgi:hypothetical protein
VSPNPCHATSLSSCPSTLSQLLPFDFVPAPALRLCPSSCHTLNSRQNLSILAGYGYSYHKSRSVMWNRQCCNFFPLKKTSRKKKKQSTFYHLFAVPISIRNHAERCEISNGAISPGKNHGFTFSIHCPLGRSFLSWSKKNKKINLGICIAPIQPFRAALAAESRVCYPGNTADKQT